MKIVPKIAFSFCVLFFSCDDFFEELESEISSVYTFTDGTNSEKKSFEIGEKLSFLSEEQMTSAESDGLAFPQSVFSYTNLDWKTGYRVAGWKYSKNPALETIDVPDNILLDSKGNAASLTVSPQPAEFAVAEWKPVTYRLKFLPNFSKTQDGEIDSIENQIQILTYDTESALNSNEFLRLGYDFAGWQKDKRDSVESDFSDGETVKNLSSEQGAEIPLYAVWAAQSITISFDANGASGTMNAQSFSFADVLSGNFPKLPKNAFSKTGYDFSQWTFGNFTYSDEDSLSKSNWPNENATLSAQWSKIAYSVVFSANGGSGSADSQTFLYEEPQNLTVNSFSRVGYDFAGWKDSAGKSYADGQSATLPNDAPTIVSATANDYTKRTLDLTAQWNPQTLTLAFDKNSEEATGSMSNQTLTFSDSISVSISKNAYSRTGYNFNGWSAVSSAQSASFSDEQAVTSANWESLYNSSGTTLYAVWASRTVLDTAKSDEDASDYFNATDKIRISSPSGASSSIWIVNGNPASSSSSLEIAYDALSENHLNIGVNTVVFISGTTVKKFVFTISAAD